MAKIMGQGRGTIAGNKALREYWGLLNMLPEPGEEVSTFNLRDTLNQLMKAADEAQIPNGQLTEDLQVRGIPLPKELTFGEKKA